ncbi:rab proteins geranylgeranyltransferase component A 2 [Anabrus simplex]|uniref:rab proteins geranylgeranyltransferase component A 2 n=1 Tax=Anabrus simplex TaxID=316456 RepID=UPI0035A3D402
MEDDLPTEYDVIVVGTGMTESIVAAAASRIGKKVLHLDSNEYYGGLWASFNFDGLQKWMEDCRQPAKTSSEESSSSLLKEGESVKKAGNQFSTVFNLEEKWYIMEEVADTPEGQSSSKKTQTEVDEEGKPRAAGDIADASSHGESEKLEREGSNSEKPESGEGKDQGVPPVTKQWSQNKLKKEYRKFNLDLAPKLLFARGSLVELLISSNIARYAEFRSVTRVLTWLDGRLEPVPCSRADVFSTKHVSVVEKRMLMKLLTACVENEDANKEFEGFEDKTFLDYLKSKKLTPNLVHYVLYAIAMATEKTPCLEGVARTQRFLNSLGRYGNTPFLWPMYGSGEIPQCFCRLCAVFGGLYHLKRAAEAVVVGAGGECTGIVSGQQRLDTTHLVMGVGYAPPEFLKTAPSGGLSRGIFVTDRSILPSDKESLTLLQFPPLDGAKEPVTIIEVGPSTNACPSGLYVLHMTCKQQTCAREDLQAVVHNLLHTEFDDGSVTRIATDTQSTQTVSPHKRQSQDGSTLGDVEAGGESTEEAVERTDAVALKPQVLWSLYYNCPETSQCDLSANVPSNVFLCSGPDLDLDFEFAVNQAKDIFTKMYPESEFLPRAPDPEEIVLEGDEAAPGPAFEGESEGKAEESEESAAAAAASAKNGKSEE